MDLLLLAHRSSLLGFPVAAVTGAHQAVVDTVEDALHVAFLAPSLDENVLAGVKVLVVEHVEYFVAAIEAVRARTF